MNRIKKCLIVALTICLVSFGESGYSTGEFAAKREYWPSGKVRVCRIFDNENNLREIIYYREDGSIEQNEKYNIDGKKIEESYYGEDGKLREGEDGWAAIKNVYSNGRLIMESYYGGDGHLKERKQYNDLGDLVLKQYVGDGSIMPEEEYNPEPTLAGETIAYYDSYARPEGETSVIED